MIKRRNFLKDQSVRAYGGNRFRNPYFQKGEAWPRWKIIALVFIFLLIILGSFGYLLFGPWLKIQQIEITGLTTVPQSEVEVLARAQLSSRRWLFLPGDQRWIFDEELLKNNLTERFHFEELTTQIEGKKLKIYATERISAIAWQNQDRYYLLGLDGQPTTELDQVTINSLKTRLGEDPVAIDPSFADRAPLILAPTMPIVRDQAGIEIAMAVTVIKPEYVQYLIDWDNKIRAGELQPTYYTVGDNDWMFMNTTSGLRILFDLNTPLEEQGRALEIVLAEYQDRLSELSYIDVRFGNNVFIK